MSPPTHVQLTPGRRVLFLTKDPELIRRQIHEGLDLRMEDLRVEDLLDDINTDAMTPAWVCFDHQPQEIAKNAYAGLVVEKKRLIPERALSEGNFEVVVSGSRKGVGSSRETAAQCEKYAPFFDLMIEWGKAGKAIMHAEMENGLQVPGWKLVNSRATRKCWWNGA